MVKGSDGNSSMELNLVCNELQPAELQSLCALKPHLFPHMQKLILYSNTELLDDDPTTQEFIQKFLVGTVLPAVRLDGQGRIGCGRPPTHSFCPP